MAFFIFFSTMLIITFFDLLLFKMFNLTSSFMNEKTIKDKLWKQLFMALFYSFLFGCVMFSMIEGINYVFDIIVK